MRFAQEVLGCSSTKARCLGRGRSQQAGWTIALDAVCLYGIVLL